MFGCFQRLVKASGHAFERQRRSNFRKRNTASWTEDKLQASRAVFESDEYWKHCPKLKNQIPVRNKENRYSAVPRCIFIQFECFDPFPETMFTALMNMISGKGSKY